MPRGRKPQTLPTDLQDWMDPTLTVHQNYYRRSLEKRRAQARAYHAKHRDEINARHRLWNKNNPDKVRQYSRRKQGILNATGETKTGPCEICSKVTNLHMDHDHETGQFRGWLCNGCNLKLGWVEKHFAKIDRIIKKCGGDLS